jgi:hypothetical protein
MRVLCCLGNPVGPVQVRSRALLECKWGLVQKRQVDDFLEVLRWSTESGVNTSEGRTIKRGIV